MKYTSESFASLSEAYEAINEQHNVEFESSLHDLHDRAIYDVEVSQTPTSIIVGCLKVDQSPNDFFEDDDGAGTFKEFRNIDSRDEFLSTLSKSSLFFLVDKYEHGNVDYSVSGTKNYPDQRWDVSHGCAVFIPCEDIQQDYKKDKKTMTVAEAKAKYSKDANMTLESYSEYCNGEVYGFSIVTYDKKGNVLNEDECWGFIGNKYANDEKTSIMQSEFNNSTIFELLKEVNITKFSSIDEIPNLSTENLDTIKQNILLNNISSGQYAEVYGEKILSIVHTTPDSAVVYHDNNIDKPVIANFAQWQKEHGVTPEEFAQARFNSDIKDVIRTHLNNEIYKKLALK